MKSQSCDFRELFVTFTPLRHFASFVAVSLLCQYVTRIVCTYIYENPDDKCVCIERNAYGFFEDVIRECDDCVFFFLFLLYQECTFLFSSCGLLHSQNKFVINYIYNIVLKSTRKQYITLISFLTYRINFFRYFSLLSEYLREFVCVYLHELCCFFFEKVEFVRKFTKIYTVTTLLLFFLAFLRKLFM